MNNSPEDFDKLQKLLKIKQHEAPPPEFFNKFSSSVIHGIEHKDERPARPVPLMYRLLNLMDSNPFAAGVFAASVCGLLVAGIAWSQYRPPSEFSADTTASTTTAAVVPTSDKASGVNSLAPTMSLAQDSGTTPDAQNTPPAQPVNYTPK